MNPHRYRAPGMSRSPPLNTLETVTREMIRRVKAAARLLLLLVLAATGCSARTSTFEIVDYRGPGEVRRFHETFDEAYYSLDGQGNVDIVLLRSTPSRSIPPHNVTQVIHIRTVWRSIPGATVAHATQINGRINYHIVSGSRGATFEGAGSVFYKLNRRADMLTGTLDLSVLRPKRRLAAGSALFKRAELTGKFHARHDPRRTIRIINEMACMFGRLPGQ